MSCEIWNCCCDCADCENIVVDVDENYVYLVNGSVRKIDKPKKKKIKHIEATDLYDENIATRIKNKHKVTNQDIKRALKEVLRDK